ncbi:hypothetical protein BCO19218_01982 [Burkholderia contaminans]|nr:hypothetical protein BCO19218_01982 [Burkholderia contaminans]
MDVAYSWLSGQICPSIRRVRHAQHDGNIIFASCSHCGRTVASVANRYRRTEHAQAQPRRGHRLRDGRDGSCAAVAVAGAGPGCLRQCRADRRTTTRRSSFPLVDACRCAIGRGPQQSGAARRPRGRRCVGRHADAGRRASQSRSVVPAGRISSRRAHVDRADQPDDRTRRQAQRAARCRVIRQGSGECIARRAGRRRARRRDRRVLRAARRAAPASGDRGIGRDRRALRGSREPPRTGRQGVAGRGDQGARGGGRRADRSRDRARPCRGRARKAERGDGRSTRRPACGAGRPRSRAAGRAAVRADRAAR